MVKVVSAEAIDNFKLRVLLSNGEAGIFDVSPYLDKGVFRQLKDEGYFRLVRVAYGGVTWPQEQDFSPETIEYELERDPPKKGHFGGQPTAVSCKYGTVFRCAIETPSYTLACIVQHP